MLKTKGRVRNHIPFSFQEVARRSKPHGSCGGHGSGRWERLDVAGARQRLPGNHGEASTWLRSGQKDAMEMLKFHKHKLQIEQ
ncbi:hypothetical protein Lal_00032383 [Lupinus albus]|uniref:Uncharacterized protein n=1 Tax=Lupinus albus TaxID=3870 RepID=A0A6A4R604_LUPAL|nr:hypothetical protein Lalb_Chr01g0015351 [Lupinus albus]KAF1897626.1 hypothetical protein Lal_00032383 [Lupinus albus]